MVDTGSECRPITIALFDDHSVDASLLESNGLNSPGSPLRFLHCRPGETPEGASLVLLADSYCMTNLPFRFPRNRRVCWLKESPIYSRQFVVQRIERIFDLVLTHREDLIARGAPFVRVDFSANWVGPAAGMAPAGPKDRLVSFIGNVEHADEAAYGFRKQVAAQLLGTPGVDCYGRGIRPVASKLDALAHYCFSVAMENVRENFYFSEKLIDCLLTETVPVYYGCPAIGEIFDPRGMLFFEDQQQLAALLPTLDYTLYRSMLPFVRENRRRCLDLGLSSYGAYLERCVEVCLNHPGLEPHPMGAAALCKPAALGRLLGFKGRYLLA